MIETTLNQNFLHLGGIKVSTSFPGNFVIWREIFALQNKEIHKKLWEIYLFLLEILLEI